MTLNERVRSVLAAGTPGPFRVGRKVGRTLYRTQEPEASDSDPLIGVLDEREDARKLALAVNLAPMFVELWKAAENSRERFAAGCPHRSASQCTDCQMEIYDAAEAIEPALAALNEAATREVGA